MNLKKLGFIAVLIHFTSSANANVVGTDAQNFNTTTSGLDFVTVQSSETLDPGVLNIGFFGGYAKNTFSYLGGSTREGQAASDSMTTADFNFGLGLGRNWDVGASFPVLLNTTDNSAEERVILRDSGMTEVRVGSKYRVWGDDRGGLAFVGSANFGLIRNNPYSGEGAGPTYNFEVAADTTISKVALGANLGYRLRNPGRRVDLFPGVEPRGDQVIASVAGSYLFAGSDTKLIGEVFSSWPTTSQSLNTDRGQQTLEWIAGLKHDLNDSLGLHLGGGTKLANGISSPDWRIYAGLNWVVGPLWKGDRAMIRKLRPDFEIDDRGLGDTVAPFWTQPTENSERFIADEILFDFGSDRIVNPGAKDALAQLVDHVNRPPQFQLFVIEGHTDSVGSAAYNLDLSQRRAANIRKFLIENHGLDPKRVKSIGYGEERPIADNGNFQGRTQNRRVEFRVYRKGSVIPEELRSL